MDKLIFTKMKGKTVLRDYSFQVVCTYRFRLESFTVIVKHHNMRVAWRLCKKFLKESHYKIIGLQSVIVDGAYYAGIK